MPAHHGEAKMLADAIDGARRLRLELNEAKAVNRELIKQLREANEERADAERLAGLFFRQLVRGSE